MKDKILAGLSWGAMWSVVAVLMILFMLPVLSLPIVMLLAFVVLAIMGLGIFKGLTSRTETCSTCDTTYRLLSQNGKCPGCGLRRE